MTRGSETRPPAADKDSLASPSLLAPADSSYAAFVAQLDANDGAAVLWSSEIDALAGAMGQDWGAGLGHVLRMAWEHEFIALARTKDGRRVSIPEPRVTVVLSGTHAQISRLIPSFEDGLASRFAFIHVQPDPLWIGGRPTEASQAFNDALTTSAAFVDSVHLSLSARDPPLRFEFDGRGWDMHEYVFGTMKGWGEHYGAPPGYVGLIHRIGVIAFRFAMVIAVIRAAERGEDIAMMSTLVARDEDVEAGVMMGLHALDHGLRFLSLTSRSPPPTRGQDVARHRLLAALPSAFSGSDAREVGETLDMRPRTVSDYLRRAVKLGELRSPSYGTYEKSLP